MWGLQRMLLMFLEKITRWKLEIMEIILCAIFAAQFQGHLLTNY